MGQAKPQLKVSPTATERGKEQFFKVKAFFLTRGSATVGPEDPHQQWLPGPVATRPGGNNQLTCAGHSAPESDKEGLLPPGICPRAPAGPSASLGRGSEAVSALMAGRVGRNKLKLLGPQVGPEDGGGGQKGRCSWQWGLGRQMAHPGEAGGPCLKTPGGTIQALYTQRISRRTAAPCCPKSGAKAAFPPQRWPWVGTGKAGGAQEAEEDSAAPHLLEGGLYSLPTCSSTHVTFLKSTQMKKPAPRFRKGIPRALSSRET